MVAGGGTGGHFFPAAEVALRLKKLGDEVLFVGVRRGIEARLAPKYGLPLAFVPFEGMRGRGVKAAKALLKLPYALVKTVGLVRRFRPDVVFCTGGYASLPLGLVAFLSGVPLYIHEQNSVPGWANLLLSRVAREVWVSFEESAVRFKGAKVVHTGNVVRKSFADSSFTLPSLKRFRLLVFGGSSGARTINRAVCSALPALLKLGIELTHQVGGLDMEWVREEYNRCGAPYTPVEFIEGMLEEYRRASLVLCRAGATSLFELSCVGRGAFLVPYPYAVGDHQRINAEVLASRGAAQVIDNSRLTGEELIKRLVRLFFNRRILVVMAERMFRSLKVCSLDRELGRVRGEVPLR